MIIGMANGPGRMIKWERYFFIFIKKLHQTIMLGKFIRRKIIAKKMNNKASQCLFMFPIFIFNVFNFLTQRYIK